MTRSERLRVGDVLRLERREVNVEPDTDYTLVGVYSFGKGIFHREPKPGSELGDYRFFRVEPGDLVLSNIQAWEGAIAFATDADSGAVGSHRFLTYVAADDRVDTNWARWFFLSEPGMRLIRQAAPGTAVRNRTLAIKRFEDLRIPIPQVEEQRRVVAVLETAVARSDDLKRKIERSADLALAAQVSMASPPTSTNSRFAWERVAIGDVVAPSNAQVAVHDAAEYRITGTYSFGKGLIDRGSISGAETSYKTLTRIEEGNIVLSKLNGWEGAVAVVDGAFHGSYVSSEYPTFVADDSRLHTGFFRGIARSPSFWRQLDESVRGSMVRRRRLSAADFMRTIISLPPMDEQIRVSQAIDRLEQAIDRTSQSASRAGAIVPAVLNREFAALS